MYIISVVKQFLIKSSATFVLYYIPSPQKISSTPLDVEGYIIPNTDTLISIGINTSIPSDHQYNTDK